jgi:RNA polymerase sigma-70 factor (ECF subfamily)
VSQDPFRRELVELLPRLRRFARALTRDATMADDLVQTAVERALKSADRRGPEGRLDSWMLTIMKNAWIDETRARGRRSRLFEGPDAAQRVADPFVADADLRAEARSVEAAMARLPDDQRLAVALVLVEGLSYAEAAAVMETPVGTLTSRVVRGRQALQAMLSEDAA